MSASTRRSACSFFFFSSRRRHTRSTRDWSSDVCSSDLEELELAGSADQWRERRSLLLRARPDDAPDRDRRDLTPDAYGTQRLVLERLRRRAVGPLPDDDP